MSQIGNLLMVAALQIKQWVTECLLFVCLYFHMLDLYEKTLAALYFAKTKSETKTQNKLKVKHKNKRKVKRKNKRTFYHCLLSYANVAMK